MLKPDLLNLTCSNLIWPTRPATLRPVTTLSVRCSGRVESGPRH